MLTDAVGVGVALSGASGFALLDSLEQPATDVATAASTTTVRTGRTRMVRESRGTGDDYAESNPQGQQPAGAIPDDAGGGAAPLDVAPGEGWTQHAHGDRPAAADSARCLRVAIRAEVLLPSSSQTLEVRPINATSGRVLSPDGRAVRSA